MTARQTDPWITIAKGANDYEDCVKAHLARIAELEAALRDADVALMNAKVSFASPERQAIRAVLAKGAA